MLKLFSLSTLLALAYLATAADPSCTEYAVDPFTCCKIPKILDVASVKQCEKLVQAASASPDLMSKEYRCLLSCVTNATEVLKDGQLQPEALKKLFSDNLKDAKDFIPIAMDAVPTCIDYAGSAAGSSHEAKDDECPAVSAKFYSCFITQIFKNCPASAWTATDPCNQMKQATDKCPALSSILKPFQH